MKIFSRLSQNDNNFRWWNWVEMSFSALLCNINTSSIRLYEIQKDVAHQIIWENNKIVDNNKREILMIIIETIFLKNHKWNGHSTHLTAINIDLILENQLNFLTIEKWGQNAKRDGRKYNDDDDVKWKSSQNIIFL